MLKNGLQRGGRSSRNPRGPAEWPDLVLAACCWHPGTRGSVTSKQQKPIDIDLVPVQVAERSKGIASAEHNQGHFNESSSQDATRDDEEEDKHSVEQDVLMMLPYREA